MSWTPKLEEGTTSSDGQWYSLHTITKVPRTIRYDGHKFAHLSYITKPEWDLLYASAVKFAKLQLTPWNVYFVGRTTRFQKVTDDYVTAAPLYWKSSSEHLLARLIYLTDDQIAMLKAIDLHGSGIATKDNYGPYRIPSYQGDGGGGGGGGDSGDSSNGGDDYTQAAEPKPVDAVLNEIKSLDQIESKIYKGSLSSLGSMVAQSLNVSDPEVIITTAQRGFEVGKRMPLSVFQSQSMQLGDTLRGKAAPISTGYIRQYWRDPKYITFGADTAIPAITGVIPNPFTLKDGTRVIGFTGSFIYYIDRQMQRLSGSDNWNMNHFISIFRQVQTAVTVSNQFTAAAKNAEKPVEYQGGSTMVEVITRKFQKFKQGTSILKMFRNAGKLVDNLAKGEYRDGQWVGFGTANAVIKTMVDNKLADIITNDGHTLADAIEFAGVDFQDIWNPEYTTRLERVLATITDRTTLKNIQEILKTNVTNIQTPIDFIKYETLAGSSNDSAFKTLRDIGEEFGIQHSSVTATEGSEIATMIEGIEVPSETINTIAGDDQTINKTLIREIREPLIKGEDNGPATMLDVIGTASGYLTERMKKVNEGIAKIYGDQLGQTIKTILTDISQINAELSAQQYLYSEALKIGDTKETSRISGELERLTRSIEVKKSDYKTAVQQTADSGSFKGVVAEINENYLECCRAVYREVKNYHNCKFDEIQPADKSAKLAFIKDMSNFGEDADNIGTDDLLKGLTQPTETGDRMLAALGVGKTDAAVRTQGGRQPKQL